MPESSLRYRILCRPSIKLIERDGYVMLGPDFAVTVRNLTALAFVVEALLFPLLVLMAALWWWFFAHHLIVLVILVILYGVLQTAFAVGLVVYLHRKMKRQTRFVLHPEGDITVKDQRYRDILLEHSSKIDFSYATTTDRQGREICDLSLEHNRNTYYLISGRNSDAVHKLCADLKNACGGRPDDS